MNSEGKFKIRVFEALMFAMALAGIVLGSWCTNKVVSLSNEVSVIRANQAAQSNSVVVKEIVLVEEKSTQPLVTFPPKWFHPN